jgi:hypothetical protein
MMQYVRMIRPISRVGNRYLCALPHLPVPSATDFTSIVQTHLTAVDTVWSICNEAQQIQTDFPRQVPRVLV